MVWTLDIIPRFIGCCVLGCSSFYTLHLLRNKMEKNQTTSRNSSLKLKTQQTLCRLGLSSQKNNEQNGGKNSASRSAIVISDDLKNSKVDEHRIDIIDEKIDLLGYEVLSGKLSLVKKNFNENTEEPTTEDSSNTNLDSVNAKLTCNALIWNSEMLCLDDVVSLSYSVGLRHFTLHAYPMRKSSCGLFSKSHRIRKDFCFLAHTSEDALQWVNAFADQKCFVNCLPHPVASNKENSGSLYNGFPPESYIRCKSTPKMLVVLNPRSGHGRSGKLFHGVVEPILKLAGFELEVVKTTYAGHARKLAASVDFSTCPDGIICVGGDGIINEVLNGLLSRENRKEAISIPIGIIPAGSDNSLIWTVLGVRDPISAAITIVKGGLTTSDVLAVEWIHSGAIHFGTTVAYFGFFSDVLELSDKYQKRFGPLRYFVAGFLKFLCLPSYYYEVEYLPAHKEKNSSAPKAIEISELYTDIMRRPLKEGIPRASSLSSIDSIMTPSRTPQPDADSPESSEFVRAIDANSKRLSSGRLNFTDETEVIRPQIPHSGTSTVPKSRSKSRKDRMTTVSVMSNATTNDKEDISSTISDPGPIWDSEPRWDTEPNWDLEKRIDFPVPPEDSENSGKTQESAPKYEENWNVIKGRFLGVLVCNHSCKTVQSFSSQVVAPMAEHDDNCLDLLLIHGTGRVKLLKFLLSLQAGKHIELANVEYTKVKCVKIKPGNRSHNGCGIDGELFPVKGQLACSLIPEQFRIIGRPKN